MINTNMFPLNHTTRVVSSNIIVVSGVQCIYHLREAHEIFVTGLEFAPNTVSHTIVGPNADFTLFSISADSQVKAHQLESRSMIPVSFYCL